MSPVDFPHSSIVSRRAISSALTVQYDKAMTLQDVELLKVLEDEQFHSKMRHPALEKTLVQRSRAHLWFENTDGLMSGSIFYS